MNKYTFGFLLQNGRMFYTKIYLPDKQFCFMTRCLRLHVGEASVTGLSVCRYVDSETFEHLGSLTPSQSSR